MEKREVIASGSTDVISTTSAATATGGDWRCTGRSVKQEDISMGRWRGEAEGGRQVDARICGRLDTPDDSHFLN
ncbi:CFC_HP_G0068370.mRNA.1.CDS.1 [Saccharomyces cerevisiae]|nr:CFC_HP_G0068370.mRNA.1.CDS.1 [Saccharomyces cerevisiae]CAI6649002.1 CFC_HP_G0068370.mRNA.1.CDS.1 [Saccharomyces cerevisiae]